MCGLAFIGPRICFTSLLTRGSSPLSISVLKRKHGSPTLLVIAARLSVPVSIAQTRSAFGSEASHSVYCSGAAASSGAAEEFAGASPPASSSAVGIVSLKAMSSVNLSFFGVIEIYDSSPRTSAPLMSKRRFSLASGRPTLHTRVPSLFFRKTKPHSSL